MSEEATRRVHAAIRDHGPIGFDEFMTLALYGPGGFFDVPPIGARRHFVTSPHVHPYVFAHCVRDALIDGWFELGEIEPLRLVELGAGDGTLAASLLEAFAELPAPRPAYVGVEISAGARDALAARGLATAHELGRLEPFEGLMFANEVIDNLPFLLARGKADGPVEVRVGLDRDAVVEVEVPWSRTDADPPRLEPGEESTVPVGAFAMLDAIAPILRRGYVLLVDYGAIEGSPGPVHGYREHRWISDVLSDPGASDVTAGVHVSAIAEHAGSLGFRAFGPVTQSAALAALGHARWERTMRDMQSKLQASGRHGNAVRVWETRSRASLLTEPSGFGRLWWLVLGTEGLGEPAWLARARGRSTD